ncbi:lysis protein [Pluralibacter gergoviae]|uniref:Lysis protein n=1 Tax=Pluralibacter gergoviae TaxID=61647 RepID=A0AAI9DRC5_PLUGE|nr:lysis protein [Pluralibacter gergoviae]EKV9910550.1 lysis protein [Pluralibacter gergoviae]EKW7276555.1 lysis protein [Pluralibacter gergoviae]ELD4298480.1 lysis protein [Pluralibacter gergoviae]ELD4309254.1 lysis protein [Pluralibacter gergoviae]
MTLRYQLPILALFVTAIGGIIWCAGHYHDKWQAEKTRADAAEQSLSMANATIADMQVRQRDVAALDAKYTKELADAQSETDALRRRLDAGGRVLVKGKCPVPAATQTTGTASLVDAGAVELSDVAGRNVLSIRGGIQRDQTALKALQEYIRTQCLK